MELDVHEHAFLHASHQINYSFVRIKGLANILFGGHGMCRADSSPPGRRVFLILRGYGNVFERVLRPGESIMVEPARFIQRLEYHDAGGVSTIGEWVLRRH